MDLEWADDVTDFRCAGGCLKVPVRYCSADCGHKLCPSCLQKLIKAERPCKCLLSACSSPIFNLNARPDADFDLGLSVLRAHCPHRKYGCSEIHQYKDLREHFEACDFNPDNEILVFLARVAPLDLPSNAEKKETEIAEDTESMERKPEETENGNAVTDQTEGDQTEDGEAEDKKTEDAKAKEDNVKDDETKDMEKDDKAEDEKLDTENTEAAKTEDDRVKDKAEDKKTEDAITKEDNVKDDKTKENVKNDKAEDEKTENTEAAKTEDDRVKDDKAEDKKSETDEAADYKTRNAEMKDQKDKTIDKAKDDEAEDKKSETEKTKVNKKEDEETKCEKKKHNTTEDKTINDKRKGDKREKRFSLILLTEEEKAKLERKTVDLESKVMENMKQIRMEYFRQIKEEFPSRDLAHSRVLHQLRALLDKITIEEMPLRRTEHYTSRLIDALVLQISRLLMKNQPKRPMKPISEEEYKKTLENIEFEPLPFQMNAFNLVDQNVSIEPTFEWTVNDLHSYREAQPSEVTSEPFECPGYPVRARVKVEFKWGWMIYASVRFYDDRDRGTTNFWPKPRVYCFVADGTRNVCRQMVYRGSSLVNYSSTYQKTLVKVDGFGRMRNLDLARFKIYVESPSMAVEIQSYDGNLNWFLEGYSRRVKSEREGLVKYQQSPYFCTSYFGYKVQLRAKVQGGEVKVCVGVVDRKEPSNSIVKCLKVGGRMGKWKSYSVDVCEAQDILKYVHDDALLINVRIIS